MKKTVLLPMAALLAASCGKAVSEVPEETDILQSSIVQVLTRSAGGVPIEYPLSVLAFSSEGSLRGSQTIASSSETLSLKLACGEEYHLAVISSTGDDYELESSPTITSAVSMTSDDAVANIPLQAGFASITPAEGESTAAIQLDYRVASLDVSLKGLPESCSAVSLTVTGISRGFRLNGENLESATASIMCHKEEGIWTSGTRYLFPAEASQTVITISYTDSGSENYCSVTYAGSLKAGTPYTLNGDFTDGSVNVTADITASNWSDSTTINFAFGPNTNTTISASGDDGNDDAHDEQYYVSSIPAPGTLWEGHIVAMTDSLSATAATLTLLSIEDWGNMTSSTNATTPGMAAEAAAGYEEFGMKGWSIPSQEDGRRLYAAYTSGILTPAVTAAHAKELVLQESGKNIRYLCDNATKTYSFSVNSINDAGATLKNYHLRLVRKVSVAVR